MLFVIEVGVALRRPPRHDDSVFVLIESDSEVEARLAACQMAAWHPAVVMPVSDRIISTGS
jgi:hypothetical protein